MTRLNQKGSSFMELVVTLVILSSILATYLHLTGNLFDKQKDISEKTESRNTMNLIAESILHSPHSYQIHFKDASPSADGEKDFLDTHLAYSKLTHQRYNDEGFCDEKTCPNAKGRFGFLIMPLSESLITFKTGVDGSGNDVNASNIKPTGMLHLFIRVYQNEKTYKDFKNLVSGSGL